MAEGPSALIKGKVAEFELKEMQGKLGNAEAIVPGAEGQGHFLAQAFHNKKFAEEAIKGFPVAKKKRSGEPDLSGTASVYPHTDGQFYIKLESPASLTDKQWESARKPMEAARTKDNNRSEQIGGTVEQLKGKLGEDGGKLERKQDRLELTKTFEYPHHADLVIKAYGDDVARKEEFTDVKTKQPRYRVVLDAVALHDKRINTGTNWFDRGAAAFAEAHGEEFAEIKQRTSRSAHILRAFGDTETTPTNRRFDVNFSFDNKQNAQDVVAVLNKGHTSYEEPVTVVEGANGGRYYIRVTNALGIPDDNLLPAAALASQKHEQEKQLVKNFGDKVGEEFIPYESSLTDRQKNGALGFRYRMAESFSHRDLARDVVGGEANMNRSDGLTRVVQEDGQYVVLLNASKLTQSNIDKMTTTNVAQIKLARSSQEEITEQDKQQAEATRITLTHQQATGEIAKVFAPNVVAGTPSDPYKVVVNTGLSDKAQAQQVFEALNNGKPDFASMGEPKDGKFVITLDAQKRPDDYKDVVKAGVDKLAGITQANAEAVKQAELAKAEAAAQAKAAQEKADNDQRGASFEALQKAFPDKVMRDGNGAVIKLDGVPADVEQRIADALHINNKPDGRVAINDLLHLTKHADKVDINAAAGALGAHQAFEKERQEKIGVLKELTGKDPIESADKKSATIFLGSSAEKLAVQSALNGESGNVATEISGQPAALQVNLQEFSKDKVTDAKKALEQTRDEQKKLDEQKRADEVAASAKVAEEEKTKKAKKGQANQWLNIGGPILGAIVGFMMGGGGIGGIIAAVAVAIAASLGVQSFTETGMFAKADSTVAGNKQPAAGQTPGQTRGNELVPGEQGAPTQTPKAEPDKAPKQAGVGK